MNVNAKPKHANVWAVNGNVIYRKDKFDSSLRVRVPQALLDCLRQKAGKDMRGMSDAVRQALVAYLQGKA